MSKPSVFKMPPGRPALPAAAETWVEGAKPVTAPPTATKPARLTIDLPAELHARFKAACARNRTRMVDEVNTLINDWTQKHE